MYRVSRLWGTAIVLASMAQPEQILCLYEGQCFILCQICDFDICDCEMPYPSDSKCYHNQTWNTYVFDCSGLSIREILRRILMDAIEVYLDGNHPRKLRNHSFIGRKNMRVLYVNVSGIESIQSRAFNRLNNLQVLNLEDNCFCELKDFKFEHLVHRRVLYL